MTSHVDDEVSDQKVKYIWNWIGEVFEKRIELGSNIIRPNVKDAKIVIIDSPIDEIVPQPGHDVIIFVVQDFWRAHEVDRWVDHYNRKFPYYKFFNDCASRNIVIDGVITNNLKYNLILVQSKRKLSKTREDLPTFSYYQHWDENYLKRIFGDDYEKVEIIEKS
jgi:uncharacterized protein (DUF608 family)